LSEKILFILLILSKIPAMNEREIRAKHFSTGKPVCVRWQNDIITSIEEISSTPDNLWIAPALFDVQVNGYGGIDFQQDNLTADDLLAAARQLRRDGCAQFFLTLITDEWPKLTARLRHIIKLRDENSELKNAIAGFHIEGPFLSDQPGFHGAHNPAVMCDPTREQIFQLRATTGSDPLLLTISPERCGAIDAIAFAKSQGIKISLGHTNASVEILRDAVKAGATGFTHLANGCPRELDRHDNILWRVFDTPGLTVSLIPDKIHVSPALFRLAHRVLPKENIFYTTDAMSAAGAPPGKYKLAQMDLEVGGDQIVRQPGQTNFAGSALKPIDGIFRAAEMLDCSWQEVWPGFSERPAQWVGLKNDLTVGSPAYFCVLKTSNGNRLQDWKIAGEI
jgi:N-acetylglucosamine-6-phosphate deacetylase